MTDFNGGIEHFVIDDSENIDDGDSQSDILSDDEDYWHGQLEEALNDGFVDHGIVRSICKYRVLPPVHRDKVWKICLNVSNRGNALNSWDGKLDLPNQKQLHDDCQKLVDSLDFDDFEEDSTHPDREQLLNDVESILTFYCKSKAVSYKPEHHWVEILRPLLALRSLDRSDLYNCFYAIISKYVPRSDTKSPYHLFRLLLQYHDPELCSFLDSKKLYPEVYTVLWFTTLFSYHCGQKQDVTTALWDIYFQRGDPYFVFFLGLVILVNAKEQIITLDGKNSNEIIERLSELPLALELTDVEDFCHLSSYYSDKTPRSFKRDYHDVLFGHVLSANSELEKEISQSICLQVPIPELLLSTQPLDPTEDESCESEQVHFFMVDCRAPERYNAAHLHVAFHLDASLMLQEPKDFSIALDSLLDAQSKSIESGSMAGGEHLCFIGTGNDELDQYMYMVVANLLQKNKLYVSVAKGGYNAITEYLNDANINSREWIVGTETLQASLQSDTDSLAARTDNMKIGPDTSRSRMEGFMKNFTSTLKTKSHDWKNKAVRFIENQDVLEDRHVRTTDHTKAYRGTQPVFSIGDEDSQMSDSEQENVKKTPPPIRPPSSDSEVDESELIDLQEYLSQEHVTKNFACFVVLPNGRRFNAHVAVDGDHLVCLREYKKLHKSKVITRRYLGSVTKITSKRSCPELITFKFGSVVKSEDGATDSEVEYIDRYLIPDAGQATKSIKQEIVRVLDKESAAASQQNESLTNTDP